MNGMRDISGRLLRKLERLEALAKANRGPWEALEAIPSVLAVVRAAHEEALATPGGAAVWAEFEALLGPVPDPPATGHMGRDIANRVAALYDAMGESPHRERLFELLFALWDMEWAALAVHAG
jgi:hypothetical protein